MSWFVVLSNPRAERLAACSIKELGIDVLLPEYVQRIRRGGKSARIRRPLFPGYLFAAFHWEHPKWPEIFSRRGVRGMLLDLARRPKPIPEDQMEIVRELASEYDALVCESVPLVVGQAVRIIDGAFNGFLAKVKRADSSPNADVEMRIFGRTAKATLPREYMAAVGA